MSRLLKKLFTNDDGATAIEYGLLGFFIALGAILALETFSSATNQLYHSVSDSIDEPVKQVQQKNQ